MTVCKNGMTRKEQAFVRTFRQYGGDVTLLAEKTGMQPHNVAKWLARPKVKQEIANTLTYCRQRLEGLAPMVLDGLVGLYQDEQTPPNVRANIGLNLLDRAGLSEPKTPAIQVNINTSISDRARAILASRLNDPVTVDVKPQDKRVLADNESKQEIMEGNLT